MQQEDLERLNIALERTMHSVQRGTQSFTATEFLAIQPVHVEEVMLESGKAVCSYIA